MFRGHESLTRSDVAEVTGLSRATVNQRLEALLAAGVIIRPTGRRAGPPGRRFAFNGRAGHPAGGRHRGDGDDGRPV